jgi:hypothetical protein
MSDIFGDEVASGDIDDFVAVEESESGVEFGEDLYDGGFAGAGWSGEECM